MDHIYFSYCNCLQYVAIFNENITQKMNGTADHIYSDSIEAMEMADFKSYSSLPSPPPSFPTTPELLFKVHPQNNSQISSIIDNNNVDRASRGDDNMVVEDMDLDMFRTNTDKSFDLTSAADDMDIVRTNTDISFDLKSTFLDLDIIRTNAELSFDLTSRSHDKLVSRDHPRVSPLISPDSPSPHRNPCFRTSHKPSTLVSPHQPHLNHHPDGSVPNTQHLPSTISQFGWYLVFVTFLAAGVVGYLIFRLQGDTVSVVLSVVVGLTVVMVGVVYFLVYCVVPRRRHKQFATYS